jgi:uroporphyrinogen decarboxylase
LRKVPSIVFTKGAGPSLERIAASGCDAVGLDWSVDPEDARRKVNGAVALQGNLDPSVLLASPDVVRSQVRRVLEGFGAAPGHVFNLGHGIMPTAGVEAVEALVDEVRTYSTRMRADRR